MHPKSPRNCHTVPLMVVGSASWKDEVRCVTTVQWNIKADMRQGCCCCHFISAMFATWFCFLLLLLITDIKRRLYSLLFHLIIMISGTCMAWQQHSGGCMTIYRMMDHNCNYWAKYGNATPLLSDNNDDIIILTATPKMCIVVCLPVW